MNSAQTGAIPKTTDRRRTLHEEFNAVADKSMSKNREEILERDTMAGRYEELKIAFNNMRVENRQLQNRLDAAERRADALSNLFQEQIEDLENKMHVEVSEQIRSLRNMNEIRFQVLEGRLKDLMDREANVKDEVVRKNAQSIRRISERQQNFKEMINNISFYCQEAHAGTETLKVTPKTPIFDGNSSPIKFLEELKDFWAAVRPYRGQAAFVISSCLHSTPKDWWDLVKEDNDDLAQFISKFKRRYWGEET